MKLVLVVLAIIAFAVVVIVSVTNGTWDTTAHLFAVTAVGLALFAGSTVVTNRLP